MSLKCLANMLLFLPLLFFVMCALGIDSYQLEYLMTIFVVFKKKRKKNKKKNLMLLCFVFYPKLISFSNDYYIM